MSETVEFRPLPLAGATLLSVRGSTRLWTYVHEKYCVTSVVGGTGQWTMDGAGYDISTASLMVMQPGDIHVTTAIAASASFDAIFVDHDLVASLFNQSLRGGRPPRLDASPEDPRALNAFAALGRGSLEPVADAAADYLTRGFALLFEGADGSALVPRPTCEVRLARAREAIADSYRSQPFETVDIREIASELGVDYYWLSRKFREHYRLTPYQYAKHLRAARARELLLAGPSPAVPTLEFVASRAGFYDYGHMIKVVKSCLGVTPADLARHVDGWRPRKR